MLSGEIADAATLDKAVTIARQFGPEIINTVSVTPPAAGHAGSAFHRDFTDGGPRAWCPVEPIWRAQHHQYRQSRERQQSACQRRDGGRRRRSLWRIAVRFLHCPNGGKRRHHRRSHPALEKKRHWRAAWPSRTWWRCPAIPPASWPAANSRSRSADDGQVTIDYQEVRRRPGVHADRARPSG